MAAVPVRGESESPKTSKQLLYAEKFGGTLLERKLQIAGKKKASLGKPCLPPPSSVLARVKEFLPKLQAANEELKSKSQEEVDIETISPEYKGPVIEMNLALVPNFEASDSDSSSSEEESEDDSDEDSDSNDAATISELIIPLNNQKSSRKRKFVLEVLDEEEKNHHKKDDGK